MSASTSIQRSVYTLYCRTVFNNVVKYKRKNASLFKDPEENYMVSEIEN